jgi:hypothetical protein
MGTMDVLAAAACALLAVGTSLVAGAVPAGRGATPRSAAPRISGPYVYENLDVYLVHGSDRMSGRKLVPLAQALAEGKVIVRETGNVSSLTVENLSEQEVYVQAGEIVKGGRQDRVLSNDLVLPPKSGKVDVGSFCVEHGRWTKRGAEEADRFASSEAYLAHKDLKIANTKGDQGEVWQNVARVQEKLSANLKGEVRGAQSASSLQLTLESERVRRGAEGYVRALSPLLEKHADAVGYVFAINGTLNSAELYASPTLFRALWPKLVRASAVEAVAERRDGAPHTPPAIEAVRALLDDPGKGAATEKATSTGTLAVARETASRVVIETQEKQRKGAWVHQSYLKK